MNAYNFNIIVLFALTDSFQAIENGFLSCCTAFDEEHLKFLKILDSGGLQDQVTNGLELPFTVGNCQDCKVLLHDREPEGCRCTDTPSLHYLSRMS